MLKVFGVHSTDKPQNHGYKLLSTTIKFLTRSPSRVKCGLVRMKIFFVGLWCLITYCAFAQKPIVTSVQPLSSYPTQNILITGSGFGNNKDDLQVWFDQVSGSIVSASDFSLEVVVPPQARLHNIEVINLANHLSSKTPLKLMPVFSGEGFAASKLTVPLSFTSSTAVFDICTRSEERR